VKKVTELRLPTGLVSVAGLALIVAGFWVLLGLGAGLLAAGVACLVLEAMINA
jgi:hypothetical protein